MKFKLLKIMLLSACFIGSGLAYGKSYSTSSSGVEDRGGEANASVGEHLNIGAKLTAIRFTGLSIPKNSKITDAYITFKASGSNDSSANVDIYGDKDTHADRVKSEKYNISKRHKTNAKITWNNLSRWKRKRDYRTGDLSSIVQEIVNLGGWNEGKNKIAFIFEPQAGSRSRRASPSGIKLHISYKAAEQNDIKYTTLTSGHTEFGIADREKYSYYKINAKKGDIVSVKLHGMDANGDLYVRVGKTPSVNSWKCRSVNKPKEQTDSCTLDKLTKDATVYIAVYATKDCRYNVQHKITATIENRNNDNIEYVTLNSGVSKFGVADKYEYSYYKINAKKGDTVSVKLHDMDANGNLYVRVGDVPSTKYSTCHSDLEGKDNDDSCSVTLSKNATVYIAVYATKDCEYNVQHKITATIDGNGHEEPPVPVADGNLCKNKTSLNKDYVQPTEPCYVPTFHNISLYWSPNGGKKDKNVKVQYRLHNAGDNWKNAQSLKYSRIKSLLTYSVKQSRKRGITVKEGELVSKGDYRGSIVNLAPNNTYDIKLTLDGKTKVIKASTWNEEFATQKSYVADDFCNLGQGTCTINKSGSAKKGYIVIDGDGDNLILNAKHERKYNINITGQSYIILRNFKLMGAAENAIYLKEAHHIVVEDSEISDWGSSEHNEAADIDYAHDGHSAIYGYFNVHSSVFQRNKIHSPSHTANTWSQINTVESSPSNKYHPRGAQPITLLYCEKGNNVFRYNEFYSTNNNYYNDGMGGGTNGSYHGFPGADSDVYGNYIANAYDDGIEVEGGGENVRVWNNYIEKTHTAIANAVTAIGPLYIWKNISGKSLYFNTIDSHERPHGAFLKMGSTSGLEELMTGQIYVFNNTILNLNNDSYGGLGAAGTHLYGKKEQSNRKMRHIKTRNNILTVRKGVNSISIRLVDSFNKYEDYAYDMVNDRNSVPSVYDKNHMIEEDNPQYRVGTPKLSSDRTGDFSLSVDYSSDTECIDNIIPFANPAIGAQEGNKKMTFGVEASFSPPDYEACQ